MVSAEMDCLELTTIKKSCYTTNMTTIPINDPHQASLAGEWCANNMANEQWDLNVTGLFTPKVSYDFLFRNPKQATEFVLRWL
jgi:hypothetical protein